MSDDDKGARDQILIVVGDQRVRSALRTLLTTNPRVGCVFEADDPISALTSAHERVPTIAVVEVHLPARKDGLSLIRHLSRELAIPVVSIGMESGARRSALQAGAASFLENSRVADDLFHALQALSGTAAGCDV